MLKRALTGTVILLLTAVFIFLKQFNSLFFDAFALIISYFSLFEVIKAYKTAGKKPHTFILVAVPAIVLIGQIISRKLFVSTQNILLGGIFTFLFIAVILLMLSLTVDIADAKRNRGSNVDEKEFINIDAFENTKTTMQIFAYPILPLSFLFALNSLPYEVGYIGIILTFVIAMMTDTFAYLFGMLFGKTKFIPEVSPKKTIAGVFGGFFGAILGTAICFLIFYFSPFFTLLNNTSLMNGIIAFSVLSIFGSYINQLGDLIASAMKRKVGIKDFGNIFPGHGGFMDRVDGQMFVACWVYLIMMFFFV